MIKKKVKKITPKAKPPEEEKFKLLKKISIRLFGKSADRFSDSFVSLKQALVTANARVLFRTYLSMSFFFSFLI